MGGIVQVGQAVTGNENGRISILIVDDHAVLRAGLRALLNSEPDLSVSAEAESGDEAIQRFKDTWPDVVLMDISLPDIDGIELTRRLTAEFPQATVIMLTMYEDEERLLEAFRAGASGYVTKRAAGSELIRCIRAAHAGEVLLPSQIANTLISLFKDHDKIKASDKKATTANSNLLSSRETEVLKLTALGYTNKEIAVTLVISTKTVESYKVRIMNKLGLSKRSELVRFALDQGLIE